MIGKIIKWILIAGLVFVLFMIAHGVYDHFFNKPQEPPKLQDAPFYVQTSSRIYYAEEVYNNGDGSYILKGYWETRDKADNWVFTDDILNIDESFGRVLVKRR